MSPTHKKLSYIPSQKYILKLKLLGDAQFSVYTCHFCEQVHTCIDTRIFVFGVYKNLCVCNCCLKKNKAFVVMNLMIDCICPKLQVKIQVINCRNQPNYA